MAGATFRGLADQVAFAVSQEADRPCPVAAAEKIVDPGQRPGRTRIGGRHHVKHRAGVGLAAGLRLAIEAAALAGDEAPPYRVGAVGTLKSVNGGEDRRRQRWLRRARHP